MGTKANPSMHDAYAAAEPDEPIFTLRACDFAHVRNWAHDRFHSVMMGNKPNTPEYMAKISEALKCAADMEAYHFEHVIRPQQAANMAEAKEHVAQQLEDMGAVVVREPDKPKSKLN